MKSRRFMLAFDAHRADGRVWCVKQGRAKWRMTRHVVCEVSTRTVYRGATATQPRAYLIGFGKVSGNATLLRITP